MPQAKSDEDDREEAVWALITAARGLDGLMNEVEDTLPGGQSDRVFAHYEFDDLRAALERINKHYPDNVAAAKLAEKTHES